MGILPMIPRASLHGQGRLRTLCSSILPSILSIVQSCQNLFAVSSTSRTESAAFYLKFRFFMILER